jgi:hypothetical protein
MVQIVTNTASGNYHLRVPRDNLLIYHSLPSITPISTQDIEAIIRRGMAHPLGAAPLPKLLEQAKTAAIVVDDWARPVVTRHTVAPIVLNLLNEHGLSDDDITVVMARGIGLSPSVETIDSAFGPALQGRAVTKKINSPSGGIRRSPGVSRPAGKSGDPPWVGKHHFAHAGSTLWTYKRHLRRSTPWRR